MASIAANTILNIKHLGFVLSNLKNFSKTEWKTFGDKCGLHYNTLEAIQANNAGKPELVEECFRDTVTRWLKRKDNVDTKGKPTLERLADIVEETGDKSTAEEIRSQCIEEHICQDLDIATKPEQCSLLWIVKFVILVLVLVATIVIVVAIIMHILSPVYASKLREKYSRTLTKYKDPDVNKFPAAGPSVPVNVPFIPLIQIIVKEYRKEDADFLHNSSTNNVMQEHDNFEKIEIENILKPLTDKRLRFVLITGEPGIGKSTLAKELTLRWVRQTDELLSNYKIVILILLRFETHQKAENIEDLLINVDEINMTEVMSSINGTKGADVLWILDGFDELPHHLRTSSSSIFIKLIKGDILPKSTVIVTSRHAAIDPLLTFLEDDSRHIALRGFGSNEIIEYASNFFKNETLADEFRSYYSRNTMIENMLYNPMTCFIMCTVFNDFIRTKNTKYPKTMTEIYNYYVRVLLKRHLIDAKLYHINDDMPQHLISEIDFDHPVLNDTWKDFYYLSKVAYEGVLTQDYIFGREFFGMPKLSMMDTIISFSGSFNEFSSSFMHTTLQEYFAAIYLVNDPGSMFTEENLKHNSNLEVVITFYVGLLKFIDKEVDNKTIDMIFNCENFYCFFSREAAADSKLLQIENFSEMISSDLTPYNQLSQLMLRCIYEKDSLLNNTHFLSRKYLFVNTLYGLSHSFMSITSNFEYFICGYIIAAHNITLTIEPSGPSNLIAFNKGLQSHSSINGKIKIRIHRSNAQIAHVITNLPSDIVIGLHLTNFRNASTFQHIISKFPSLQEITFDSTSIISELPLLNLKELKQLNIIFDKICKGKNLSELLKQLTTPEQPLKQLFVSESEDEILQNLKLIEMQSSLEELRLVALSNPFRNPWLKIIWCSKNNSLTVSNEKLFNKLYLRHIGASKIQLTSFTSFRIINNDFYAITIYSEPMPSNLRDFLLHFNNYVATHIIHSACLNSKLMIKLSQFMYGTITQFLPNEYNFFYHFVAQCSKWGFLNYRLTSSI